MQPQINLDTKQQGCPDRETLSDLIKGKSIPDGELSALEDHLPDCLNCQAAMESIAGESSGTPIDRMLSVYRQRAGLNDKDTPSTNRQTDTETNQGFPNDDIAYDESGENKNRDSNSHQLPSIPGYTVHQEIGRGGMGVVFRATDRELNRPVAIKMIGNSFLAGPERVSRFLSEAKTIAKLNHRNIVKVFDVGDHHGQPYFAMELIQGESLQAVLDGTPWDTMESVGFMIQLANAVHAAHREGVIHRDLKPANILISATPTSDKFPQIVDFGLAKNLGGDSLTITGDALGTPSYMSPEQASGATANIGPATDIYALGCILCELLTGRPPFRAASIAETLRQIANDVPAPLRSINKAIPIDLETICLKCLGKNPASRYATGEELAADLDRFQAGRPIMARRISTLERGWKWVKRHPSWATLWGVIMIGVFAFLGVWWKFTTDLRKQTSLAVDESIKAKANASLAIKNEGKAKANLLKAEQAAELQIEGMAFLNDMTYELTTLGSQDKLVEALNESRQKIEPRLKNRPLPMASYLLAMATTYLQVGEHQLALDVVKDSEEILVSHVGEGSRNTTHARIVKLDALINLGKLEQARNLINELSDESVEFFNSDRNLLKLHSCNLYCFQGNYAKAIQEATEYIDLIQMEKEPNLKHFVDAHGILGVAYSRSGDFESAGEHFFKQLEYSRKNYPPGHYAILWAENTYGVYLANVGRADEAIELLSQSVKVSTEKLGKTHKNTIELVQNLASAMSRAKRYNEAEKLFKEAIEWNLEHHGPTHQLTMGAFINLTVIFLDLKRYDEGFEFLKEHCPVQELAETPSPYAGRLLCYYAKVCLGANESETATELLTALKKLVGNLAVPDPYLERFLETAPAQIEKISQNQ